MKRPPPPHEPLLSPAEVGDLLRVGPRTVARWADLGRFPAGAVIRTPQGHRRYKKAVILAMLNGGQSADRGPHYPWSDNCNCGCRDGAR